MYQVISTQLAGNREQNSRALTIGASLAFVLAGVVTTFLGPILPFLASRWRLSDSQSGYFFATEFLASTAGVIVSGVLLQKRGYRFCIGISYFLMAIGVTGLEAHEWRIALLGTLGFGIGLGIALPSTNLLISTVYPDRPAAALSVVNFCWGVGAVLAPVGLAVAQSRDNMPIFLVSLSVLLFASAIALSLNRRSEPITRVRDAISQGKISDWPFLVALGAMFFIYVAVETSVGGWIATLAERAPAGAGQAWILAPAVFWAGLVGGRGIAPLLLRWLYERTLAIGGLTIACAGITVLVVSRHRQWITVAGGIVGAGLSAVYPITVALLPRLRGLEKRLAGPMFALAGLGGAVMPWFVGAVSTRSGSLQTGLLAPLLCALLLLVLHVVWNRRPI